MFSRTIINQFIQIALSHMHVSQNTKISDQKAAAAAGLPLDSRESGAPLGAPLRPALEPGFLGDIGGTVGAGGGASALPNGWGIFMSASWPWSCSPSSPLL